MIILPEVYFGSLNYYRQLLTGKDVCIDVGEYYVRQSYRNRCTITGSHGKQHLVIPVKKAENGKLPLHSVQISYAERWQQVHLRSIQSCYGKTPYFDYFYPEFEDLYTTKTEFLFEWNRNCRLLVFKILRITDFPVETKEYMHASDADFDYRNTDLLPETILKYTQPFVDKNGFIQNLSILDLLFNEGTYSYKLLTV
jgi:hypothetical protein